MSNVPSEILNPRNTWDDKVYTTIELEKFKDNFKFEEFAAAIMAGAPNV
jgi:phosphoenolpyruvate carboxykinase (ATP)